jgi:hypothetical protein
LPDRLANIAAGDVSRHESQVLGNLPRLGLVSVARLCRSLDPSRSRWALQHLPYATARYVRSEMDREAPETDPRELSDWESRVWTMAKDQLAAEHETGGAG